MPSCWRTSCAAAHRRAAGQRRPHPPFGTRVDVLIEDLLELARAEAGQLTVKLDQVVLCDVVHDAVEEHRAAAEAAGLTLVHARRGSKTILTTDPARVTQVLGNLLSNAIKYTPAGGHIEVAHRDAGAPDGEESGRLAIHVVDDGPGIPADKYEEMFGEFTRLDSTDKPGAGLGLSIARRVARLLGGDVTVSGGQSGGRDLPSGCRCATGESGGWWGGEWGGGGNGLGTQMPPEAVHHSPLTPLQVRGPDRST